MTSSTHLESIRGACIEANPEIEKQKCVMCGYVDCDRSTTGCPAYIGRPIRLADILIALETYSILGGWQFMVDVCGDFYALPDGNNPQIKSRWNLRKDNLEDQSEECLAFLASLLV